MSAPTTNRSSHSLSVQIRSSVELSDLAKRGAIPGSRVAPNPGGINGQIVADRSAEVQHWSALYWTPNETYVRYLEPKPDPPILVVRRVTKTTARITDMEGTHYSETMCIEDALALLRGTV